MAPAAVAAPAALDLDQLRELFPGWRPWRTRQGQYMATRRGDIRYNAEARRLTTPDGDRLPEGAAMTVCGDLLPESLYEAIRAEEARSMIPVFSADPRDEPDDDVPPDLGDDHGSGLIYLEDE